MTQLDPATDYIHFPDDTAYTGKLIGYQQVAINGTTVYLPVTVLTDVDGNVLDLSKVMTQANDEVVTLLRGLVLRLDILNSAVDKSYSPPDYLYKD